MKTLIILGIFASFKTLGFWGTIASLGLGLGIVKKWAKIVDFGAKWLESFAGKMKVLFGHVEETASDIDDSIDDETGRVSLDKKDEIVQDVKDVIGSAKEVVSEVKGIVNNKK